MPWQPLPRIAFAVATYPFTAEADNELPLEIGDDLYIIEQTPDGQWLRGYLLAPPSLLSGLTSSKGQTLEARVFSGIFPRSCVEIREVLGDVSSADDTASYPGADDAARLGSDSGKSGIISVEKRENGPRSLARSSGDARSPTSASVPSLNGLSTSTSIPPRREPGAPKPPAPVPMLKIGDETPTSSEEPLVDEIASCLREWHSTHLHELLLSRQYSKLDKVAQLIHALDLSRRQFLHNVLTSHEYDALREKTVWDLVKGNKLCSGEVIVRDPRERGRILTGEDSVVEITKLQSVMSLLDEPPRPHVELTALHHLCVDVKSFAASSNGAATLMVYLVGKPAGGLPIALTESYVIDIPAGSTMENLTGNSAMRTLFTDLSAADIGDAPGADTELYLVVKVRTPQQVVVGKPGSRSGVPHPGHTKDKPSTSGGNKASRRSGIWGSTRSAFSRGGTKLDALSEIPEERQSMDRTESRESGKPPSTAGSIGHRPSMDGLQPGHMMADRMLGVAVMKLNQIMKQTEETEHVMTVWAPSIDFSAERSQEQDEDWDDIINHLLGSKFGQYAKSRTAERLQIHLKPYNHPDAEDLIKETPTLLSGISKTQKMGFSGAPTKPRSDIYITINEAHVSRQNLLSRYGASATTVPHGLIGSNLMVTVEVRRESGDRIENCILPSSNSQAVTTWKTYAVERGEPWNQVLRLSLSPQDVLTAHIVMTVADLPNAPFAIAYFPLWDQQAFIRDGSHALLLYKLDDSTQTAQPGPSGRGGYLSVPWGSRGDPTEITGPLANLRVGTYLCSTRFSQNRVVLGLLRWKEQPKEDVPGLLKQLVFVPEIEIVKLLNEVLDALFAILVERQGSDEYEDLVFSALVRVLGMVHDRRFNLEPLVDDYAETKFKFPFATPCLVRSFTRLLTNPTDPETARNLRATLKVVRNILKFITRGRQQQEAKEAGVGITSGTQTFSRSLQTIFKALDAMMRSTAPVLVGSQTLAVQYFHTWLPELTGLLDTEEILHIAIDFLDSCSLVKGKLVLYKLVLIINYSKLDLFSQPDQRAALCANTARWMAPHWGQTDHVSEQWKEQVRLCCSVLASQVELLGNEIPDYIPKIVDSYLAIQQTEIKPKTRLSLLFPSSYPFPYKAISEPVKFDEALIELSAVLSALGNTSMGMQLELADDDLGDLIQNILQVHMSILQGEAFPSTWLSVHIFHHKSTMWMLQYVASILLESFLPDPDDAEEFSTELWKMFFTTLLKLVGSHSLALETFPEQKRRAVWKIAGDVREHGAELLRRTWEAIGWETTPEEFSKYGLAKIGGYQVQYVPTLVGPIVELCLSVHQGLRQMAVEVLQVMIVSEWTLSEDLSVIQMEMIDTLDLFFKDKPITESILQKLFIGELLDRFEGLSHIDGDPLYAALQELINTVDEFLDLLVAVHSGEGNGAASELISRLQLMEFLRDMNKEEIFIRYVHQLATIQTEARNYTEAGLALRLHADLYEWNPLKILPALQDPYFPAQSHFERKERIYFDMIKQFEDGEAWSSALTAYKELQNQYENNVFDFAKLARTERAIATIYETLGKSEKLVPKYYKVVFKGLGFPPTLRDKEFIYEGAPTEKRSGFTDRMQEQYQSAQIIINGDVESEVEGQYLVVSPLTPQWELSNPIFQRPKVPQVIRDYMLSTHPQSFSITSKRDTSGPVQEHYAEKVIYTTANPFPTILRRSEIVEVKFVRLSSKETALERIVRKTQEMTTVEKQVADGDMEVAQVLLDAVGISLNPDNEHSVVRYRELLPIPDPEDFEEVELDPLETAIKVALMDHAIMIRRCLTMFSTSSNASLRTGYENLHQAFEFTFAPELEILTPPQPARINTNSASSPSRQKSLSSPIDGSPKSQDVGSPATNSGAVVEEASSAQHVSLKGRGNRLSFLGGKRKPAKEHNLHSDDDHHDSSSQRSKSKDGNSHRMSFFRSSSDTNGSHPFSAHESSVHDWAQSTPRKSGEMNVDVVEKSGSEGFNPKLGSVRKRLSMLKLGGPLGGSKGRGNKMQIGGALAEE